MRRAILFAKKTPALMTLFAVAAFNVSSHAYPAGLHHSEPLVLRKEVIFNNWGANNPLFETEKESVSCVKDFYWGNHNVPIRPGHSTTRPYYEYWDTDACVAAPKRLIWKMTATRAADQLNVQCRIGFTTDIAEGMWSTKVTIEPYRQEGDDLCTSRALVVSAKCLVQVNGGAYQHRLDCLNKFVPGHAREIEVTLNGPQLVVPEPRSLSPFGAIFGGPEPANE
jgi:hypothetical protein